MIFGYGGNDMIEGGSVRPDEIFGGEGDDIIRGLGTLYGDDGNDTVTGPFSVNLLHVVYGGDGDDSLSISLGSVYGGDGNDAISNRSDDNYGGAGNDTLYSGGYGGAGDDLILLNDNPFSEQFAEGGDGKDTLEGAGHNDRLYGGNGKDRLIGSAGYDQLFGGAGRDFLNGGQENDTLDGGGGSDKLTGGTGTDVFVFDSVADIGLGGTQDEITDFASRVDRIDLRALDTDFTFVGGVAFSGTRAELRYDTASRVLFGDVDGNGTADFSIKLNAVSIVATDILI